MEEPKNYSGPKLNLLLRDPQKENKILYTQLLEAAFGKGQKISGTVGTFAGEQYDGSFAQDFKKGFEKEQKGVPIKDCTQFFEEILLTKDQFEIDSLRISAKFTEFIMKQVISECEDDIEKNTQAKHDELSKKMDRIFDKRPLMEKFLLTLPSGMKNLDENCLEFAMPVNIQSGGEYNLKFECPNNHKKLSPDTIIVQVCTKYKDLNCYASRTMLISPVPEQKETYEFLLSLFKFIVEQLKVGSVIADIHNKTLEFIKSQGKEHHIKHLPKIFGYGIGLNKKEDQIAIKQDNQRVIEKGMVFNIRLSMANFDINRPNRNALLIADTVLIGDKTEVLTSKIPNAYADISYSMDENDEIPEDAQAQSNTTTTNNNSGDKTQKQKQQQKKKTNQLDHEDLIKGGFGVLQNSRLRATSTKDFTMVDNDTLKAHQEQLFQMKQQELQKRLENDDIQASGRSNNKTKDYDSISSYKSTNEYPKDARNNQIYVDKIKNTLLVPIKTQNGSPQLVPFHIHTIKNASMNTENNVSTIRINFHVPGQGVSSKDFNFPSIKQQNTLFIKEISFKSHNTSNFQIILKQIKDLLRQTKINDQIKQKSCDAREEDQHLAEEVLIAAKSNRLQLDNVNIKPTITGKKTVGCLETHCNGFRFVSTKGHKVDFTYKNIKHAIFQPCENDLIVLLHFRLRAPITVGNKKTLDLQFFTEICALVDDLDSRARRRMNEQDELEQEERERVNKSKLNEKFLKFVKAAEKTILDYRYDLQFDIPMKELEFTGCHAKSSVKILPTANCLVALSEIPFFVLDMSDVEIAHFERVQFMTKNFDLVFVYKDFQTFKRISVVPMEFLETIKCWLDSMNILFSEGQICLNWPNVLQHIRDDFDGFVKDGGWSFILERDNTDDREDKGSEDESDSEYNESDEMAGSGGDESESDYSDDEEDDEDAESSEVDPGEESEEEGMDWDEMEQQTIEQERRQKELFMRKNVQTGNSGGGASKGSASHGKSGGGQTNLKKSGFQQIAAKASIMQGLNKKRK